MNRMTASSNSSTVAPLFPNSRIVARTDYITSREIGELTGRRHDQVLRTAREMVALGVTQSVETLYTHEQNGQQYPEHRLSKRDSLVLVARLSPEFTARLVDRWQELEEQVAQAFSIPATYAEALQVAADQATENQKLQLVILRQAPKVAAIERLASAGGAICITDAANHLQIKPNLLFTWLQEHRWIFRRGNSTRWVAMAPRITAGLLIHKVTALKPDKETGLERASFQPLVTPKGLTRLAELMQEAS
jgi:phage regulator Rha-like protein